MEWVTPKTITGAPAEDSKYLKRQYINDEFWKRIENGEHILFSAPRRVGKSSIMKDLEKNFPEGIETIHDNIESDKTQRDLFKRIFTLIIERLETRKRLLNSVILWFKTKEIGEISADGKIKLNKKEINYKEELLSLIQVLGNEQIRFVMLLDEFPEVIQNIKKNEGDDVAVDTLHTLRSIRQDKRFKHFSFAFAGSIGLDHIVSSLDRLKLINDLVPVYVEPLTITEAKELIGQLIAGATIEIKQDEMDYLLKRINYLLPYYIQLMIEKCDSLIHKRNSPKLTKLDIDQAFELVIQEGRNFGDWESRLSSYFNRNDTKYCIAVLTRCAHSDKYSVQQAYNLSKEIVPDTGYKQLIDEVLKKDGYLIEDRGEFKFLSPFLKEWWRNRHPIVEIEK